MKKFLLGVLLTLILSIGSNYLWENTEKETSPKLYKFSSFMKLQIFDGGYVLNVITKKCVDEEGENGFGWKFNVADYYQCDKFQRTRSKFTYILRR